MTRLKQPNLVRAEDTMLSYRTHGYGLARHKAWWRNSRLAILLGVVLPLAGQTQAGGGAATTPDARVAVRDIRASSFNSATPISGFTIDACFVTSETLFIGGRVGPDSLIGRTVEVSSALEVGSPVGADPIVRPDGTFLVRVRRRNGRGLALSAGDKVTVTIRPSGEIRGVFARTCTLEVPRPFIPEL